MHSRRATKSRSRSRSGERARMGSNSRSRSQTRLADSNTSTDEEEDADSRKERLRGSLYVSPALRIAVSGMSGVVFGIALEKGRVFEPQVIRDQMLMRRFVMMKMFLAASTAGVISFTWLKFIPQTMKAFNQAVKEFASSVKMKTALAAILGAGILGCGMTIAGSCPGLVTVQVGAGISTAVYIVAGAVCGSYLYALTHPYVSKLFLARGPNRSHFLPEYLKFNYMTLAIPLAAILAAVIIGIEYYFPWDSEVEVTQETVGLMKTRAWPPIIAGILVGCLQIPIILANQDTLGTTTSYVTIASQVLVVRPLASLFGHLKRFRFGLNNWWQVFFIGGSILGSFLSAQASSTWGTVEGVYKWQAFGGGLLMLYGARMAGGCTSGHGLSGMGLLALTSLVAVPAMFGGAIATAFALQHFGIPEFQ